jgi:hypothetical protein
MLAALALSWTGSVDQAAKIQAQSALERVLIIFTVSRTLNGVISVAQGTEIALQPAGVGVTLTAGEILDPLNDLVERFSWLATAAAVSLGAQVLVTELLGSTWINLLLTAIVGFYLLTLSIPSLRHFERAMFRTATLAVFGRLTFAVVVLSTNWLGNLSLTEKQDAAVAELSQTKQQLVALNAHNARDEAKVAPPGQRVAEADSILDRVGAFFSEQRDALDVGARLEALQQRAELAVTHLVTLSVIFLLQYLVLPIGALWLVMGGMRTAWRLWWAPSNP